MDRERRTSKVIVSVIAGLIVSAAPASSQDTGGSFYREGVFDGALRGGDLNISSFVFRDSNRSGRFDLGDRAMANIAVEMFRPDGSRLMRRSNISGFANFEMSVLKREADIVDEGRYRFVANIPPAWELTTGNGEQERSFRLLPGAPADLVSLEIAEPLGFAPVLTISGRIAANAIADPPILTAISPSGEAEQVAVDGEGYFAFSASPGAWTLEAGAGPGEAIRRLVDVGDTPVQMSMIDPEASEPAPAPARTNVTFEELIRTEAVAEIPSSLGGVGWRNWVAAHNRVYSGEGYVNSTISGEFVGYNSSGHPAEIFSDTPFDFLGGYFGAAWRRAHGEELQVTGWRGDSLVYRDRIKLSVLGPVYFSAQYRGVTRIEFATEHYWQFVAEDLSFGVRN